MRMTVVTVRAAAFGAAVCGGILLAAPAGSGGQCRLRGIPDPSDAPAATLLFTPAQQEAPSERDAALDRTIRAGMENASSPGAIVGIWQEGEAPYVRAFGVRDRATGQPMSTDLHMRIGSVTKTFVVTALLQLVDRRRVRLDDPIAKYVAEVPGGERITLRQLAAMRSGLYSYTDALIPKLPQQPHRQWRRPELLASGLQHPPLFEPGKEFDYSNTNTVLLGRVIEKVTGVPLEVWIRQQILEPLCLTHTFFPTGAAFPTPHAQGYMELPDGKLANATDWNPSWAWAAGQMISTLDDLRTWTRISADGTLLTPASQRERTAFLPAPQIGEGTLYGLGLINENGWIGHGGNIVGYFTFASALPSRRTTMVVMLNASVNMRAALAMLREITKIISPNNLWPNPPPDQEPEPMAKPPPRERW